MAGLVAVTGAAGALGRVVTGLLSERGYEVVAIDLQELDEQVRGRSFGGIDLAEEASVGSVFATLSEDDVRLHGLVNLAGGFAWEAIEDGSVETWDRLYRMNLRSPLLASRAALQLLGEGSAIVNVSAAASQRADMGMGAYAASKAGVSRLTESLAAELKDKGIRVNAVLPSIIDTPANRRDMPDAEFDRWVAPHALAEVIAFLLSDAARAVTGALIPVTGRV